MTLHAEGAPRNRPSSDTRKPRHSKNNRNDPKRAYRNTPKRHRGNTLTRPIVNGSHNRTRRACERCRMKKTKCSEGFPCKRCEEDDCVCTVGPRERGYKNVPRGYPEVLEQIHFSLVGTIHKLYYMLRKNQQWDLGEPALNSRGQPLVHNIAAKLGCIRPVDGNDPFSGLTCPQDKERMVELERQLGERQAGQGTCEPNKACDAARSPRLSSRQVISPNLIEASPNSNHVTWAAASSNKPVIQPPQDISRGNSCNLDATPQTPISSFPLQPQLAVASNTGLDAAGSGMSGGDDMANAGLRFWNSCDWPSISAEVLEGYEGGTEEMNWLNEEHGLLGCGLWR